MSLYGASVKRPIMTTLCFVTVIILGLFSLAKLPIDLYPDIDTNTLMAVSYTHLVDYSDLALLGR